MLHCQDVEADCLDVLIIFSVGILACYDGFLPKILIKISLCTMSIDSAILIWIFQAKWLELMAHTGELGQTDRPRHGHADGCY